MDQAHQPIRKPKWVVAGVVLLVLTIFTSAVWAKEKGHAKDEEDFIAKINDVPISLPEFERAVQWNKSSVLHYFQEKYHAAQTPEFWTTSFQGEIPVEMLKKKAFDDSLRIKVRQLIAKEQGVVQDISYDGFLQQLQQENVRRKQAIQNHEVVYGPEQYQEEAYFEYRMTNETIAVKQKMSASKVDEAAVKQFYDLHKDERYVTSGYVKVQRMSIPFLDAKQQVDPSKKEQALIELEKVRKDLAAGASFADLAQAYMATDQELELTYYLGNDRQNARSPLAQAAAKLSIHGISSIIEEHGSLHVMKCIEKVEPGSAYVPLEEIREQVRQDMVDDQYESYVSRRLLEATIVRNESQYLSYPIPR
ncbi:hypothetical protein BVG16_07125 [Paenibacillus selenitireducens]|uniref:peptidylprolyl isomerase n=1 Tax=Paenibacillus selenitireducens TaxID=1324314 RepID=A0A1T2XKY5_9BACL|nr:peptidylprolyl isomerase [Paenibacillus selenitireducens]OPA80492.1 hypothetical protein BVG16_07125 [Paenibacillus selenitireducens]